MKQKRVTIQVDTSSGAWMGGHKKEINMITFLKIFLGCKGTWFWACRQMQEGKTLYRLRDSGVVYFTYDNGRRKIKAMLDWDGKEPESEWGISMEDVFTTDFMLLTENTNYEAIHHQSQMKCDMKPLKEGLKKQHTKKHSGPVNMGPAPKPIRPAFPKDRIEKHNP